MRTLSLFRPPGRTAAMRQETGPSVTMSHHAITCAWGLAFRSRLRLPAHSAAGSTARAARAGLGRGRGRGRPRDSEDREQLIDVRARALLAGDVGCGGTDYSLEPCSTLTAFVFEYGHRSTSVIRTAPGNTSLTIAEAELVFQPVESSLSGLGAKVLSKPHFFWLFLRCASKMA
jgi:hypothetical protein